MLRERADPFTIVIGVFSYASDARRALNALPQHQFTSSEVEAAFRAPLSHQEPRKNLVSGHETGKWFGQLRQIYHGSERTDVSRPPVTDPRSDALFDQMHLSESDELALSRDLDRGGAIVAVKAGERNPEARTLLEELGGRIVQARSSESAMSPPQSDQISVASAPFVSPKSSEPDHIQLFGEVLRVHKEKVATGDVHVRKESVTRMETVQVPVTRELLVVEDTTAGSGAPGENAI